MRAPVITVLSALLLAGCEPPEDIMKGGGGMTDEEELQEVRSALSEGRAFVCASGRLHHSAIEIIDERLNRVIPGDEIPVRTFDARSSIQVSFDPQTHLMICQSEMMTWVDETEYRRPVLWTAQPSADGFDIRVTVDMSQF